MTVSSPALEPIADLPIQQRVLQRLRDAIIDGTLPPGAALRIDRLAAELGVSPMPVREALHVLTVEGLAVRLPRRGVRVSALSAADLTSAYDTMAAIEGLAGRTAARNLTDATLGELHDLLAAAPALVTAGDSVGLMRVNRDFHARIYDACRNRWVVEFCRQLWNYVYRLRRRYPQSPERQQGAVREHECILEALTQRDGACAEALIREHCARSRDDLLAQLAAANVPGFAAAATGGGSTAGRKSGSESTGTDGGGRASRGRAPKRG